MLRFLLIKAFFLFALCAFSQGKDTIIVYGEIINGDTVPLIHLPQVSIYSWKVLSNREERQFTRLMKNVKIVYPYARLAGIKLREYEDTLAMAPDDKARKKIMKKVEDQIEAEYGKDLRDLTVTQGKILLKLIDRETGESSYELVADLRGEFRAVFYQAFARIFGLNMKLRYDPEGEDSEIEYIVQMIESGQL